MLGAIARRLFGTANERFLKTLQPNVDAINAMESELEALSDDALRARLADVRGLSSWRISISYRAAAIAIQEKPTFACVGTPNRAV